MEKVRSTTSLSNYRKEAYHINTYIRPNIGNRKISDLTEYDCQKIIDAAYRKKDGQTGDVKELSKKSLMNIRATLTSFLKMCRVKKATTLFPENLSIPKGARYKGKEILQPSDLITLFDIDTTLYRGKRVPDEYIYAYRFCVLTGLRPGELLGLERKNISGTRISIDGSINVDGEHTRGKMTIPSVLLS